MNKTKKATYAMLGIVAIAASFVTACSNIEALPNPEENITEGIRFDVNDVQETSEASLPKTHAASVYATRTIDLQGEGSEGFYIDESTIEGVNPMQITPATRGSIKTAVDANFSVFAAKPGEQPAYLYNAQVGSNGVMATPKEWKVREASALSFYAICPATATGLSITPNTATTPTKPVITYSPAVNAKNQVDLLVAANENLTFNKYEADNKITLPFTHATTAIIFQIGKDLSYNRKVEKIELIGVYGKGKFNLTEQKWEADGYSTPTTFTLDYGTTGTSTANVEGTVLNPNDGTFLMLPQTLPSTAKIKITFNGGKTWTASIAGKEWVQGTTKTYKISNTNDTEDRDFEIIATPAQRELTYLNDYAEFAVRSYRRPKEYTSNDRDKAEPWTVEGYNLDNSNNWIQPGSGEVKATYAPDYSGGTNGVALKVTVDPELIDKLAERNKALKTAAKPTSRLDLSMVNGVRRAANCYIVSAPGEYQFPIVYGNALDNNGTNEDAYKPSGVTGGNALTNFKSGWRDIDQPYITQGNKVEVIWQSNPGLVTAEGVTKNNGTDRFIKFKVDENNIEEGNAIIALKYGNTIYWSWHIWITGKEVANVSSGNFMLEPLGYKHDKWEETRYLENRTIYVKLKQTRADGKGKYTIVKIIQQPHSDRVGKAMYYQFGRKDPMQGNPSTFPTQKNGYSLVDAARNPLRWGAQCNINNLNPHGGSETNMGQYDWNRDHDVDNSLINLWDGKNTVGNGYTGAFVKTVYDPSPAGFHVPRVSEFSRINGYSAAQRPVMPTYGFYKPGIKGHDPEPPGYRQPNIFHETNKGMFWSCLKYIEIFNGRNFAFRGIIIETSSTKYEKDREADLQFGANILPIKE